MKKIQIEITDNAHRGLQIYKAIYEITNHSDAVEHLINNSIQVKQFIQSIKNQSQ